MIDVISVHSINIRNVLNLIFDVDLDSIEIN